MDDQSQLWEKTAESQTLVVTFSHMEIGDRIAPFCFVDSIRQYPVNRLYVRDLNKRYYLQGIDSKTNSIERFTSLLKEKMANFGSEKVIFIGNSGGGFAALLYGMILQPTQVLAFAPRTYLDNKNRQKYADTRNSDLVNATVEEGSSYGYRDFLDLMNVYKAYKPQKTRFHICWDKNNRIDDKNAKRLWYPDVIQHSYENGSHLVAKHLKNNGLLHSFFRLVIAA